MKEKKKSDVAVLLGYAGNFRILTFLGMGLSAVAMILGMAPYVCIRLTCFRTMFILDSVRVL